MVNWQYLFQLVIIVKNVLSANTRQFNQNSRAHFQGESGSPRLQNCETDSQKLREGINTIQYKIFNIKSADSHDKSLQNIS